MRGVLVASLIMNGIIALGAVGLLAGWDTIREQVVAAGLDEDWERAESFFDSYPVEPGDVVFLGDSLTAGAHWAEVFPGSSARNRGVNGQTTRHVLARIEQVTAGRPAKVFLLVGGNDLYYGVPAAQALDRYAAILDALRRDSPDTRVYVQSLLPGALEPSEVATFNGAIEALAHERGMAFIDLRQAFALPDGSLDPSLTNDGAHLLGPGYRRWQRALAAYVAE